MTQPKKSFITVSPVRQVIQTGRPYSGSIRQTSQDLISQRIVVAIAIPVNSKHTFIESEWMQAPKERKT